MELLCREVCLNMAAITRHLTFVLRFTPPVLGTTPKNPDAAVPKARLTIIVASGQRCDGLIRRNA